MPDGAVLGARTTVIYLAAIPNSHSTATRTLSTAAEFIASPTSGRTSHIRAVLGDEPQPRYRVAPVGEALVVPSPRPAEATPDRRRTGGDGPSFSGNGSAGRGGCSEKRSSRLGATPAGGSRAGS